MPISVASPELLLLGALLIALTLLLSRAARHHLSLGRRRAEPGPAHGHRAGGARARAGRASARAARRPADHRVRGRPLRQRRRGRSRAGASAYVREALAQRPGGDQAAVVAFGREALVERLPGELDGHRPHRVGAHAQRRPTSAARCGWRPRCSPTRRRSGSCSSATATTPPGGASPRRRWRRARGVRIETYEVGLGGADEVILQRPRHARHRARGRRHRGRGHHLLHGRPAGDRAPVRRRRPGRRRSRWSSTRGLTRVRVRGAAPREAGFHTFRAVVEAARDTFGQNDRADSDTVVKGDPRILLVSGDPVVSTNLAAALETERQDVDAGRPRRGARATSPALASLRLDRARRRARGAPGRGAHGRAPGRTSATSAGAW